MHLNSKTYYIKRLIFGLIILVFISCEEDCKYIFKGSYIESNCYINQGFFVQELKVDSLGAQGVPSSYSVSKEFTLSMKNKNSQKKIFFYKPSPDYEWIVTDKIKLSETLPLRFEIGKWYKVRGLMFRGNPNRAFYVKPNKDGDFKVFGYSESKFY